MEEPRVTADALQNASETRDPLTTRLLRCEAELSAAERELATLTATGARAAANRTRIQVLRLKQRRDWLRARAAVP